MRAYTNPAAASTGVFLCGRKRKAFISRAPQVTTVALPSRLISRVELNRRVEGGGAGYWGM